MGTSPTPGRLAAAPAAPSDEDIVNGARAGEAWAVALLYRDVQPRLLRYLRVQLPEHAEDLASDVWVEVANGLARFEGTTVGFRAWVFTIARRRVIDQRRKAARRRTDLVPHDAFTEVAGREQPEDVVVAALSGQAAVDLLAAALSPEQAEVVLLRVVAGLSVEQVSEIMARQPGAVRVLQHRALRRLARHLGASE